MPVEKLEQPLPCSNENQGWASAESKGHNELLDGPALAPCTKWSSDVRENQVLFTI